MIDPSDYREPRLLSSLIEQVLSEEDWRNFRVLESAFPASKDVENLPPPLVILKDRWDNLKRIAGERIKVEVRSLGDLSVFGWPENCPNRQPQLLDRSLLRSAEFLAYNNEIRVPDGPRYQSCVYVATDVVSLEHGIYMANKKPLFFWHENPPTSWYGRPVDRPARSRGRPRDPKLTAAQEEAERREALGESTAVANAAAAEQFGVTPRQVRDRRKPSRVKA
jgi:hypothetical protein